MHPHFGPSLPWHDQISLAIQGARQDFYAHPLVPQRGLVPFRLLLARSLLALYPQGKVLFISAANPAGQVYNLGAVARIEGRLFCELGEVGEDFAATEWDMTLKSDSALAKCIASNGFNTSMVEGDAYAHSPWPGPVDAEALFFRQLAARLASVQQDALEKGVPAGGGPSRPRI